MPVPVSTAQTRSSKSALPVPSLVVDDSPDRFFVEVAVGVQSFDDLCEIYGLSPELVEDLEDDPLFIKRLKTAQQVVEDDGSAFQARCRTVANDTIPVVEEILRDPETPPGARLDAFKTMARLGRLEPHPSEKNQAPTGPVLSLTIIAPDGSKLDMFGGMQPAPITIDQAYQALEQHDPDEDFEPLPLLERW